MVYFRLNERIILYCCNRRITMKTQAVLLTFVGFILIQGYNALECTGDTLKVTIKTLPSEYEFDVFEQYEMRATIAYAVQKYCGETSPDPSCPTGGVDVTAANVTLTDITERISMCAEVTNFTPDRVRQAIRISKANLNGALILTDEELFVDGILPTLSPVPTFDFPPWLIAYIVIFGLLLLGALTILLYSRRSKKNTSEEDKESMLSDDESAEEGGKTNNAFVDPVDPYEEIGETGLPNAVEEEATPL